jgi:hypothetical protein
MQHIMCVLCSLRIHIWSTLCSILSSIIMPIYIYVYIYELNGMLRSVVMVKGWCELTIVLFSFVVEMINERALSIWFSITQ